MKYFTNTNAEYNWMLFPTIAYIYFLNTKTSNIVILFDIKAVATFYFVICYSCVVQQGRKLVSILTTVRYHGVEGWTTSLRQGGQELLREDHCQANDQGIMTLNELCARDHTAFHCRKMDWLLCLGTYLLSSFKTTVVNMGWHVYFDLKGHLTFLFLYYTII